MHILGPGRQLPGRKWGFGGFFLFCFVFLFGFWFVYFCFLGLHLRHLEDPRLGVELELQLPAHTTATATRDPSHICDLPHSSGQQRWILNPLSQARDGTRVLVDTSPQSMLIQLFVWSIQDRNGRFSSSSIQRQHIAYLGNVS